MNERYARQILLPEIGRAGQKRLSGSSAFVVGCGGLGCTLLSCLCGMGVGRIGFCDGDVVSLSNLNRQFLYTPADAGQRKTDCAARRLSAFAPELALEPRDVALTQDNVLDLIACYDVVLLALDNVSARIIAARACMQTGITLVDAGVRGLQGTLFTYRPGKTACPACIYGEAEPTGDPDPSFAPTVSAVASLEAQAAANVLLRRENPTDGTLLLFDGACMTTEFLQIHPRSDCPICGKNRK